MNVLFLDDSVVRQKMFRSEVPFADIVTSAASCIEKLESGEHWDYVFLDHDLNQETFVDPERKDCGMEVVRWIVENQPSIKKIYVHSHNVPVANHMVRLLKGALYDVEYVPFQYKMGELVV